MKVIKFPRDKEKAKLLNKEKDTLNPMFLGAFKFTCDCGNSAHVKQENMIFKSMEFYCKECGKPHKVSNPAFAQNPPTRK